MRRPGPYLTAIACVLALLAVGSASAEEPIEVSLQGEVPEPLEVRLPTPPSEQLQGRDIRVDTWSPQDRPPQIIDHVWVPGEPSRIRVIDARNNDPSRIRLIRWSGVPDDSGIVVHRWEPGRASRIRVH